VIEVKRKGVGEGAERCIGVGCQSRVLIAFKDPVVKEELLAGIPAHLSHCHRRLLLQSLLYVEFSAHHRCFVRVVLDISRVVNGIEVLRGAGDRKIRDEG
jgi:hypothetical protein